MIGPCEACPFGLRPKPCVAVRVAINLSARLIESRARPQVGRCTSVRGGHVSSRRARFLRFLPTIAKHRSTLRAAVLHHLQGPDSICPEMTKIAPRLTPCDKDANFFHISNEDWPNDARRNSPLRILVINGGLALIANGTAQFRYVESFSRNRLEGNRLQSGVEQNRT